MLYILSVMNIFSSLYQQLVDGNSHFLTICTANSQQYAFFIFCGFGGGFGEFYNSFSNKLDYMSMPFRFYDNYIIITLQVNLPRFISF